MSEQIPENPSQPTQPDAPAAPAPAAPPAENPFQQAQPGAAAVSTPPPAQPTQQPPQPAQESTVQEFQVRLLKRPTGTTHWNVAAGVWELVTHAETGEPEQEYALVATIDGVDVPLESYNAGRLETIARSLKQTQQTQPSRA